MFRSAIVRIPGENFAAGLTTAGLGKPDYLTALAQHEQYRAALESCGLEIHTLQPDLDHPDATFVEDAAVVTSRMAVLANPGEASRKGEVAGVRAALAPFYERFEAITAPGTLDGGDVCEADGHFFIGLSERTNEAGARQLAGFLARAGYSASFIQVTGIPGILHLKSGMSYLGDGNLVLIDAFLGVEDFQKYRILRVSPEEAYAANCVRVNNFVLVAQGFPRLREAIETLGYRTLAVEMSEFQKMDGGVELFVVEAIEELGEAGRRTSPPTPPLKGRGEARSFPGKVQLGAYGGPVLRPVLGLEAGQQGAKKGNLPRKIPHFSPRRRRSTMDDGRK